MTEAVETYDEGWREADEEMEKAAARIRKTAPENIDANRLEDFLLEVRDWGEIRQPGKQAWEPMARALIGNWQRIRRTRDGGLDGGTAGEVVDLWQTLVDRTVDDQGHSRPLSWASKALHWLMPDRAPVYDSRVRNYLDVGYDRQAYRGIVAWCFQARRDLGNLGDQLRDSAGPCTTMRALDKFVWMQEGD